MSWLRIREFNSFMQCWIGKNIFKLQKIYIKSRNNPPREIRAENRASIINHLKHCWFQFIQIWHKPVMPRSWSTFRLKHQFKISPDLFSIICFSEKVVSPTTQHHPGWWWVGWYYPFFRTLVANCSIVPHKSHESSIINMKLTVVILLTVQRSIEVTCFV